MSDLKENTINNDLGLWSKMGRLEGAVDNLEKRAIELQHKYDNIEPRVTKAESNIAGVILEQVEMKRKYDEIDTKMDKIITKIDRVHAGWKTIVWLAGTLVAFFTVISPFMEKLIRLM